MSELTDEAREKALTKHLDSAMWDNPEAEAEFFLSVYDQGFAAGAADMQQRAAKIADEHESRDIGWHELGFIDGFHAATDSISAAIHALPTETGTT